MHRARLPTAERKQAHLVQAHAFDHYLLGMCGGRFPVTDARTDMRCPLCLNWQPTSEFRLEHAPQRADQSRLGPPWVLVSTCRVCNEEVAGAAFESDAATIKKGDGSATDRPICRVHGTAPGNTTFNAEWMSSHEPVTVTDLKSAYLIAFAVLGYSWATARRLDLIRSAFVAARPPDSSEALVTCGLVTDPSASRTVWEVSAPIPMVLLVGPEAEFVVALPMPGTDNVSAACEAIQGRTVTCHQYRWPLMVRTTQQALGSTVFFKPEGAWDEGLTFHLDRCGQPHSTSVSPSREATRAMNREVQRGQPGNRSRR